MQDLRDQGTLTDAQVITFRPERPGEELYDVQADPYELNNLAGNPEYNTILERMHTLLIEWQEKTGDSIPEIRTPDEFDRESGEALPNHKGLSRTRITGGK
jgi:hypothetical protein